MTFVPMTIICISAGLRCPSQRPSTAEGAGAGEGMTTGEVELGDCSTVGAVGVRGPFIHEYEGGVASGP